MPVRGLTTSFPYYEFHFRKRYSIIWGTQLSFEAAWHTSGDRTIFCVSTQAFEFNPPGTGFVTAGHNACPHTL